jgi:hypothetical protein
VGGPPHFLSYARHAFIAQFGTAEVGLSRGVYCAADHKRIASVVATESALFFKETS